MSIKRQSAKFSMQKRTIDAVVALDKIVSERSESYLRLEQELQHAKEFFRNEMDRASALKSDLPAAIRKKRGTLKAEEQELLRNIQLLENQKAANSRVLTEIENTISQLKNEKDSVSRQIDNRSWFDSTVKVLFGDSDAQKKQALEEKIQTKKLRKNDLLAAVDKINAEALRLNREAKDLNEKLGRVQNQLHHLENDRYENERKLKTIRQNQKNKSFQIKSRKSQVKADFDEKWLSALKTLDNLIKKVRTRQPHLNELKQESINRSTHFPDVLAFGRIRMSYENWRGYVPRLVPFPLKNALWLPDTSSDQLMIHQLLLRMMCALPVGSLEITAIDPLRLGTSLSPFLPLLKLNYPFTEQRLLTGAAEIETTLQHQTDYMEDLLQNRFKGSVTDWIDYNSANAGNPLPYKILLIFGVPEQLTDSSLWYLGRLMEHGPRCGVLPVLTMDEERLTDRKYGGLRESLESYAKQMTRILPSRITSHGIVNISVCEEHEFWPETSALSEVIGWLHNGYKNCGLFTKELQELWGTTALWQARSTDGLNIPIGWTHAGKEILFSLGEVNTEHHALLAGRSGSGKSNLLHVLIHSLCHRYSPEEVKVYLLDYKQGTEFNTYANPPLPQAALVATESDPEYGVTVLTHLSEELEQRAAEFKRHTARDIQEYRQKTQSILPRIVLIIDEFQLLFSEGRQVAEPAEKLLNQLLRQGRAYGIHVLLATQTLKGIQSLSMGQLISQIGCRLALACSEEDSAMILANTNWEASTLNSPPEGLLNNSNGAKSANQRFLIPFADREICSAHQNAVCDQANRDGYGNPTRVFNGSYLPLLPSEDLFESLETGSKTPHLLLGEELSFEASQFSVSLERRSAGNLLIAGYNNEIHDGLLLSILHSLGNTKTVDEIIYFNARAGHPIIDKLQPVDHDKKAISVKDSTWNGDISELLNRMSGAGRVLIIDGLDSAKMFHGGPPGFRPMKKDEPVSPAESLKKLAEDGPQNGTFVISFVDNWRRCNTVCKDLLNFFELRIGFCLNEDDAGSLTLGNIGKLKGLEHGNKAVFIDRLTNRQVWLRPFINRKQIGE